jgi:hypothetical protein
MLPNLLNMAMTVVGQQSFTYYRFLSRSLNAVGQDVAIYDAPKQVSGQVQAAPRKLFDDYGLEFQESAIVFYVSRDIIDIDRNVSGDQIKFGNKIYKCLTQTSWLQINGWTGVITIEIQENNAR